MEDIRFAVEINDDTTSNFGIMEIAARTKDGVTVRLFDVDVDFNENPSPEYMPKIMLDALPGIIHKTVAQFNANELRGSDLERLEEALQENINRDLKETEGYDCWSVLIDRVR